VAGCGQTFAEGARGPTSRSALLAAADRRHGHAGYAPDLEDAILPQVDGITEALRNLAKY